MTNRPPNGFLQSLTIGDFELLRPHLRDVKLEHSKVLFDVGGKIPHVYFPHSSVVSLVVVLFDGDGSLLMHIQEIDIIERQLCRLKAPHQRSTCLTPKRLWGPAEHCVKSFTSTTRCCWLRRNNQQPAMLSITWKSGSAVGFFDREILLGPTPCL